MGSNPCPTDFPTPWAHTDASLQQDNIVYVVNVQDEFIII